MVQVQKRVAFMIAATVFPSVVAQQNLTELRACPAGTPMVNKDLTCTGFQTPREYFDVVLAARDYDTTYRPSCGENTTGPPKPIRPPVTVETQISVQTVSNVNPRDSRVVLSGYWRRWWKDARLVFDGTADGGCFDRLNVPYEFMDRIWHPDLYIDNMVTSERSGVAILTIFPDGTVFHSEQITVVLKVDFFLNGLPMDTYNGYAKIASYANVAKDMRVIPRGGVVGAKESGVGTVMLWQSDPVWEFTDAVEEGKDFGVSGEVEEIPFGDEDTWDLVKLKWNCQRQPRFYYLQIMLPSIYFNAVAYIQFWVSAPPARATIAVIPILILRNLGASVYDGTIPKGGSQMWITDYLFATLLLCCLAAAEFGVVQMCSVVQTARKARLDGLVVARASANKLFEICEEEKVHMPELLKHCKPKKVDESDQDEAIVEARKSTASNPGFKNGYVIADKMKQFGLEEADLVFIRYAQEVFEHFDADDSDSISPLEIRKALVYFDIYCDKERCANIMCAFLRDEGHLSPVDVHSVTFGFNHFMDLLMHFGEYNLRTQRVGYWFQPKEIITSFENMGPGLVVDTIFRWMFPILMLLQNIIFFSIHTLYKS